MIEITEKNLVAVAKRENNKKRNYLVVNRLQGKHIPVKGNDAFYIFDSLAQKLEKEYNNERLLIVGFCETATAIGARLAVYLNSGYMQTTREIIDNVQYLFFTESHSHATEQKLVKNDIDSVINNIDRIIFAEDEVTTGNTIMKIINIIENTYPSKIKFSVASLLNGMDAASLNTYNNRGINVHYLVKTNHSSFGEIADSFKGDGEYHTPDISDCGIDCKDVYTSYINARRLTSGGTYEDSCGKLFDCILKDNDFSYDENVLIAGTEEFMYPALYTAKRLNDMGINAVSHSTSRSPIAVSSEDNYPLHKRFELRSLYDSDRVTYIYDLKKYDKVIIITDSPDISQIGLNSLVNALKSAGSNDIKLYRWCKE